MTATHGGRTSGPGDPAGATAPPDATAPPTDGQAGAHGHAADDGHVTGARFPWALKLLVTGALLYAAFGKGFAYAGWPPVFVGEVLLVVLVLVVLRSGLAIPRHLPAALTALLGGMVAGQVAFDIFFGPAPTLEVLRGSAPTYYATFAFLTYGLLRLHEARVGTARAVAGMERMASRITPLVLAVAALLAGFLLVPTGFGPTWPVSGVPMLFTKATDISVTLAMLLPFALVRRGSGPSGRKWRAGTAVMWIFAALLVVFRSRSALIALAVGPLVARPRPVRLVKMLVAATTVLIVLYMTGLSVTVGNRELSARAAIDATTSLLGRPSADQISGNYVDTRDWRRNWWGDIWADATEHRMLARGFGWGDNLAVRYGVVPRSLADDPRVLRLPHNVFFSYVGRGGLAVSALFLLIPILTLIRSFRDPSWVAESPLVEAARSGVAAAVMVALGDIYLESPQGGILYWCLIGLLWWAAAAHGPPAPLPAGEPATAPAIQGPPA